MRAADSSFSLTIEDIQRFIDSDYSGPSRTLVAPNKAIAELWAKQYPGWTILLSAKNPPTSTTLPKQSLKEDK